MFDKIEIDTGPASRISRTINRAGICWATHDNTQLFFLFANETSSRLLNKYTNYERESFDKIYVRPYATRSMIRIILRINLLT